MRKTKQRREKYQSGSLWEENGKWWLRYSEKHADGKTERPTVCVGTVEQFDTKRKARLAADRIMEGVNEAAVVTRWDSLCDDYVRRGIGHLRGHSQQNRRSVVNTLKRAFGDERLDRLATAGGRARMEDWLNGQKISANHRHGLKAALRLVFRHAMKQDLLMGDNPVDLIDTRNMAHNTVPKRRRELITPEQYDLLQNDPELPQLCKVILAVMEYTGLRGCETLALSWEHGAPGDEDHRRCDIDFDSDPPKIWVRRSVKEGKYIDEPKTPESQRTVAMTAKLAGILLRWKGTEPIFNNWVFGSSDTGRPWTGSTIRHHVKAAAARHGFDYCGFGLHNNRHTFKRAIEAAGASTQQQMRALGHTNPRTLFHYGAGIDNAKELAPYADKVVSILDGKTGTN